MVMIASEEELAAVARALTVPGGDRSHDRFPLARRNMPLRSDLLAAIRDLIEKGDDPLGEAFCRLRSPAARRSTGAIYTPSAIVLSMVRWAAAQESPTRIVDPGCGSGRFIIAAARQFPDAALVAVDADPLAVLLLRANASVLGLNGRLTVHCADYRRLDLPSISGSTLFIGNPPYVRHHDIDHAEKAWLTQTAAMFGLKVSQLAGLHVHFFLKTRQLGRTGDIGAFVTSAEWLDVNYGSVVRSMLANGLGGTSLHVLAPESMPFENAATTGAIACFRIGRRPERIILRSVPSLSELGHLTEGRSTPWSTLEKARRWTQIVRPSPRPPTGYVELGALCRVHRGQVTGGNRIWIEGAFPGDLPRAVLTPAVTKARELIGAGAVLRTDAHLRRVIDLPVDLASLDADDLACVETFLKWATTQGARTSYIASHRREWWSVRLRSPAPILCTYMARRPPAFVRNLCGAGHINIAHGLYPRQPLREDDMKALVAFLSRSVSASSGRTYAGGLTKFEPRELERVPIPKLEDLHAIADQMDGAPIAGGRGAVAGVFP
jgi:predicted RNA methylase